jgi:hypothetical protein
MPPPSAAAGVIGRAPVPARQMSRSPDAVTAREVHRSPEAITAIELRAKKKSAGLSPGAPRPMAKWS